MLWWQMPSITRSSEVTGWSKQAPWKCGGKWKSKNLTSFLFPSAEKYFDMKKAQCKEGLDIYKKFLTRMTRISEFLKVAEVRWCKPAYIMSQYAWGAHKKKKKNFPAHYSKWESIEGTYQTCHRWGHKYIALGFEEKLTLTDCLPFLPIGYLSVTLLPARHGLSSTAKLSTATLDSNECGL